MDVRFHKKVLLFNSFDALLKFFIGTFQKTLWSLKLLKINFCRYILKAQTKNQDYSNCISVHSPNSPMINSKKSNTSSRVDAEVVGLVNPIFSENFALKIVKKWGKITKCHFLNCFRANSWGFDKSEDISY